MSEQTEILPEEHYTVDLSAIKMGILYEADQVESIMVMMDHEKNMCNLVVLEKAKDKLLQTKLLVDMQELAKSQNFEVSISH